MKGKKVDDDDEPLKPPKELEESDAVVDRRAEMKALMKKEQFKWKKRQIKKRFEAEDKKEKREKKK